MNQVLLNNVDHHDLRVIATRGAQSSDRVNQVMVFPTEFESVQQEYPIVFRKAPGGAWRPFALLGLTSNENLFLDEQGHWQSRYVPALLQRGPFSIAAPEDAGGEPMIRIDLDHPQVSRSEGMPLFLPHGGNSPYLMHMTSVLRTIYVGHHLLDPMIEAFGHARLLRPVNLEARVGETEVCVIPDVQVIDRERLAALQAEVLGLLHGGGFLQAAFLAAASMTNMQRLTDLKNRRLARDASA